MGDHVLYIAVDPGRVSGVAVMAHGICKGYEVPARKTGQSVHDFMSGSRKDVWEVAMERYTITPGIRSAQPHALMVMGAVEYVCDSQSVTFHYYTPGMGKRVCDNDLLRRIGWWQPTKDGHANDAKRILLTHLAVRDPDLFGTITGI